MPDRGMASGACQVITCETAFERSVRSVTRQARQLAGASLVALARRQHQGLVPCIPWVVEIRRRAGGRGHAMACAAELIHSVASHH